MFLIYLYIGIVPLVVGTAICDWRITVLNKRFREASKTSTSYSLSRNFQLIENTLAMRLIFPLDVFYALLYTVFTALTIVIRSVKDKDEITKADYIFYYYNANLLNYCYTLVTIIVCIQFVHFIQKNQKKRTIYRQSIGEESKLYFRQLRAQWQ